MIQTKLIHIIVCPTCDIFLLQFKTSGAISNWVSVNVAKEEIMHNCTKENCAWISQAPISHDHLLKALISNTQKDYNWMMDEAQTQLTISVLPSNVISALDYGDFAKAHRELIDMDAQIEAYAVSRYHKKRKPLAPPPYGLGDR